MRPTFCTLTSNLQTSSYLLGTSIGQTDSFAGNCLNFDCLSSNSTHKSHSFASATASSKNTAGKSNSSSSQSGSNEGRDFGSRYTLKLDDFGQALLRKDWTEAIEGDSIVCFCRVALSCIFVSFAVFVRSPSIWLLSC